MKYYSVVTFGCPASHVSAYYRDLARAIEAAHKAKGSGSCTNARVYECDTRELARTADISEIRAGESIAYCA